MNAHLQCNSHCNKYLSGNVGEYRIALVKKYGEPIVQWIEAQPKSYKYTRDDALEIKAYYREQLKWLKREDT